MCLNCGCGQESNRHGSGDNITIGDVKKAMKTRAHRQGGNDRDATAAEMKRMARRRRR